MYSHIVFLYASCNLSDTLLMKLKKFFLFSLQTDDRSNIATYEPLRGPVIQLKNDHYREKPALPKSTDYDYDSPEYSHMSSSIRHLPSSSPPTSSSWLSRLSSHPHTSVSRKDKYEMSSSTNKPLSLDRGSALKLPRPSRDLIVGITPSAAKRIKPAGNVDSHSQVSNFFGDILRFFYLKFWKLLNGSFHNHLYKIK